MNFESNRYRGDIDGLRAVAVVAVVLYHTFPGIIKGGFVGVDIFFVISGFLISILILYQIKVDKFNIGVFYATRIRRLFPALCLVLLAVTLFGFFFLVSTEYVDLGKHIASATMFVSNIALYLEGGYFEQPGNVKPLLHFWSLGVEVQFYLVWPLLVALFWRKGWSIAGLIFASTLFSFSLNLYLTKHDTSAAFFWPVSRFWEFMAGCALAFTVSLRLTNGTVNIFGAFGFALIFFAVIFFEQGISYPGWAAIVPVIGTALVIAAGPVAWTNRVILSNKFLVHIGLISYPLYLWHWPLLSYAYILEGGAPSKTVRLILLTVAIFLAWLTYILVEKPIRLGILRRKEIFLAGILILLGGLGLSAYFSPSAFGREALAPATVHAGDIGQEEFYRVAQQKYIACEAHELHAASAKWTNLVRCFQSKTGAVSVALIGDSHAEHLMLGLANANPNENIGVYVRAGAPILQNERASEVLQHVLHDNNIRIVVLAWWWRSKDLRLTDTDLVETVRALRAANKSVYLVEDGPLFQFLPSRCKYAGRFWGQMNHCEEVTSYALRHQEYYTRVLAAGESAGAHILKQVQLFCTENTCSMAIDKKLMLRDAHHLNVNGSIVIGSEFHLN
jgi:peptidoglycan/LPS O-acetylase OafA/YrhL